jgi:hypothetical protein
MNYHNDLYFGLAKDDCHMVRVHPSDWLPPTFANRKKNEKQILEMVEDTETEPDE